MQSKVIGSIFIDGSELLTKFGGGQIECELLPALTLVTRDANQHMGYILPTEHMLMICVIKGRPLSLCMIKVTQS